VYHIIQELELDNSRLAKEAVLAREAVANNQELFEGIRFCLDNLTTFGVKQVPKHGGPDGQGLPWAAFKELLHLLYTRQLTGHDARAAIELALSSSTQAQWNDWYRRILIKDLRCGVSEKTVNKILKQISSDPVTLPLVPVFECMLAHDGANHEKKISGKKLLEHKLDGVRVITVINAQNKTVMQYTRNGKLLENFSHITQAIESNIDQFERSLILDGEMISSSFQDLMKQVHRKEDVRAQDARLVLFDILPLTEFQSGKSVLGQRRRSNLLRSLKPVFDKIGHIDIISQIEVDLDQFVGELQFKEFNEQAIAAGYEGILVKDPEAKYECKRSYSWLKIKPFLTVDLAIVSLEEGTGKNQGRLGALICEGTDQGKFIRVNVGSGLTDEQRDEIWKEQNSVIGQVVEIKADCVTKNQDSDDIYSLRFPRFERFRGFRAGSKI
jgi:DNA ligase-1